MALDKAIKSGKEHRKPYTGSKAVAGSCRNHGRCEWCAGNRKHKFRDKQAEDTWEDDLLSDAYWVDEDGNLVEMHNGVPETSCWCSRCKHWLVASDEYDVYGYYCPYCGAPMNKGKQL